MTRFPPYVAPSPMELEQRIAETRAETRPIERQVITEHPTWNEEQVVAETTRRWLRGNIRRTIAAARPSWTNEQIDAEVSRIMRDGVR
jgi:hypothetical protein